MPPGATGSGSPYDAVLFDLDRTVWRYRRSADEHLAIAFEEVDTEPRFTAAEYVDRISKLGDEADSEAELRRLCFGDLAVDREKDPDVAPRVADAYTRERDYRNVDLLPGATEALAALDDRYRVAAVTNNAPEAQAPKFEELGVDDAFETVVYGGTDAPTKPAPEPFDVVLDRMGGAADRAVHVGDSLESDVAGAARAGLDSVWVPHERPVEEVRRDPTYRVDSLRDLVDPPWE